MKVLIIEDSLILSRNITKLFIEDNIFAEVALDGIEGLKKALEKNYDIIILDVDLPGIDGFEVCKKIRQAGKKVGIIMLTSLSGVENIVSGLNLGADDYLTKPFEYDELFARIQVILRRKMSNLDSKNIQIQNLNIDLEKNKVFLDNLEIKISKIEFDIFKYLAQNRGKIISRNEIFSEVWGRVSTDLTFSRTLDVHMKNLRKKIGENVIQTKKGFGFLID